MEMYDEGALSIKQKLPLHSFEQILIGFNSSSIIENELKEYLPEIDHL